jgi:hypothetical protein
MDHLPHGGHPVPLEIPYLSKEPYSHEGEWLEYPSTQGFNLDHLRVNAFYHYPPDTVAAFLQSWLYFGLIFSVLPFKPDVDDFLEDNEKGRKVITTSMLPVYFEKWKRGVEMFSKEEKLSLWRKNHLVLEDAHRTICYISGWPDTMPLAMSPIPPVSREMALSFALLGRALELANREILNPEAREDRLGWSSGSLLLEHMESQGWCPFLVAGIDHTFEIDGKYYASTIGPPRVQRNHRRCTDEMCTYRSNGIQHVTPTCPCLMFSPDIDKMSEILAEDKLPLLLFVTNSDGKGGELKVVPGESGTNYVAMSHVWSDGLGNFAGNSMPACQLDRIQKAVDSLYHDELTSDNSQITSVPFWMDTLLIPNDPKLEKIKDATIVNMTQIYKNAKDVLVIDSEVATCSSFSDPLSVLHRILLSNWLRRLWTLQEGVFASSIHFLLSDGTTSLGALLYEGESRIGVGIKAWTKSHFTYRFGRGLGQSSKSVLIEAKDPDDSREEDLSATQIVLSPEKQAWRLWDNEGAIIRVVRAVADRVSTFQSDEALCLALLLGIDARSIIAAKNKLKAREDLEKAQPDKFKSSEAQQERLRLEKEPMLTLLRLVDGSIPPGVLLLPGPWQDDYGFRWAPKSFLNGPHNSGTLNIYPLSIPQEVPSKGSLDRLPSSLCRGGGGLKVMFPGFRLGEVKENCYLEKTFVIDTLPSLDLGVKGEVAEGNPPRVWQVLYRDDPDDPPWVEVRPNWQNSSSMGIIICSYTRHWQNNALTGLMVRLKGSAVEEGEISMHVERICKVIISGAPEYDDQSWVREPEKRVSGSWLPVTQKWCVD